MKKQWLNGCLLLLVSSGHVLAASEYDGLEHGMSQTDHKAMSAPQAVIKVWPVSGQVREGGFQGGYVMTSVMMSDAKAVKCTQARQGLIMLDRKSWAQCSAAETAVVEKMPQQPVHSTSDNLHPNDSSDMKQHDH